jgi:hypothetical protein
MKTKGSTFIKCEFCDNPHGAEYATIDRKFICHGCHAVLLRHGIGKNEEQIESEKQRWATERIAEVIHEEYGPLRSPASSIHAELDMKSIKLRFGLFLLGAIVLWGLGEASLITLAVTFIAAILIAREYKAEQSSKLAGAIQAELAEDERKIKEGFDQCNKRVTDRVESEAAQLFSRYTEIMRHANQNGIQLWEYFRYPLVSPPLDPGYPPDWELRKAKVKERDGYRCQNCDCEGTEYLQVHHKKPVRGGGTHHLFNLTTICRSCHYKHHFGESNSK